MTVPAHAARTVRNVSDTLAELADTDTLADMDPEHVRDAIATAVLELDDARTAIAHAVSHIAHARKQLAAPGYAGTILQTALDRLTDIDDDPEDNRH